MIPRPISITIIGWFQLVSGILGLLGYLFSLGIRNPEVENAMEASPLPPIVNHAIAIVGTVAYLVAGYYILKGRNWARYLYVIWSAFAFSVSLITSPWKLMVLPGIAIFAVITFFLFRPAANRFFADGGANIDPQSIPSTRRIVSVAFYVLAGLFFAGTGVGALMSFEGGGIVKTIMVCIQLLPFVVCLAIGRSLSPGPVWKRDVGIVIVAGAAAGALMAVTMAVTYASPGFRKSIPTEHENLFSDYGFAVVWLGAWGLLGTALLLLSRKPTRGAWDDRTIPRLVDR